MHGKIVERPTLFGIYPPKIAVWSRSGVAVIGNFSGLKAVVFLWRFGPLLCDASQSNLWDKIAVSHQPFFSLCKRGNDN